MASTSDTIQEDKRLLARVDDALTLCRKRGMARFVGFLDERQATLVRSYVRACDKAVTCCFFGGHAEAERVMLGIFASDQTEDPEEVFPVTPVAFRYRREASLTHRDVLGSLIGCGLAREKIGDILCKDGLAVVFLPTELADFVAETVTKIGREGVLAEYPFWGELPAMHSFEEISGTIASVRLDAVLRVLMGTSREQAARRIQAALVSVNHQLQLSVSSSVKPGDIVSVKGVGRFVIDDVSGVTKKGRLILKARKYV